MPLDKAILKQKLLDERASILEQEESDKDVRAPQELDQTRVGRLSRMDAMQMQAMASASHERRKGRLVKIEQALKRLETDDYGYCLNCDDPIEDKRLEFDPTIQVCMECLSS